MSSRSDHDRIAELIDRITGGSADTGLLSNEVLAEFQRGLPVRRLLVLLKHPDANVVELGAWIAAELGLAARPLLDDIIALLRHPSRNVRFYAIDVVLATTAGIHGSLAAKVLPLLDDDDVAVRWKATGFLGRASAHQLESALDLLAATAPNDPNVPLLKWLLSEWGRDSNTVRQRLVAGDGLTRRYAVAAAVRLLHETDEPLRVAAHAADDEVRRFAQDWLSIVGAGREDRGFGPQLQR